MAYNHYIIFKRVVAKSWGIDLRGAILLGVVDIMRRRRVGSIKMDMCMTFAHFRNALLWKGILVGRIIEVRRLEYSQSWF